MRIWHRLLTTVINLIFSLISFCLLWRRENERQIEKSLLIHFNNIRIEADPQEEFKRKISSHEGNANVTMHKMASFRVDLDNIKFVEVWRYISREGFAMVIQDELSYIIPINHDDILRCIPILTNIVITKRNDGKTFHWNGFTWGNLPLLKDRLIADEELNEKLNEFCQKGLLDEMRIHALSNDSVSIITDYNSQKLPTRELISCIEDISKHIVLYAFAASKYRDYREDTTRKKLSRFNTNYNKS